MNNSIFYFFYNFAHRSDLWDKVLIFLALYLPYVVVIVAGLFLLFHHDVFKAENPFQVFLKKKKEILSVFFISASAWVVATVLKLLIHLPRPALVYSDVMPLIPKDGFAFPSGHATFFIALAFAIFYLHKRAGYVFMALALIIGLARIAVGVHFPADILGGFIIGGLVAYFVKMYSPTPNLH